MPPSDRAPDDTIKAVLADELSARILRSRGGRRLLAMDHRAMREFLTSAASSLSVRPTDDPDLKATIDAARADTRQRVDVVLSADTAHLLGLAGALTALEEAGHAPRNCAGVSGGAIVGALLAAGYLPSEIVRVLQELDVRALRPKRTKLLGPRGEIYSVDALVDWLTDVLGLKNVATFRDLMLAPELRLSTSLQVLAERLPQEVTTVDVLRELFPTHPSYGGGRAGKLTLEAPSADAAKKTAADWCAVAWELFAADSSFLLDGRRLVCALAYLDAFTCTQLSRDGFLDQVEREVGTLEAELNDDGRRLREGCRGGRAAPSAESPGTAPEAAAREYRLQVLVLDRAGNGVLVLPRDAPQLGLSPAELAVPKAVAAAAATQGRFEPVRWTSTAGSFGLEDVGPATQLPVGLFDVTDARPQWPTFGLAVASHALAAASLDGVDAARTIFVPAPFPASPQLELTPGQRSSLYEAGYASCREFLDGWDFGRWLESFRAGR